MLHCEYYATSCPHRSAKLHTGFDPVIQGLLPKDKQLKLKDYFIKQIRSYMNGDIPVATVVKGTSASSNTKSTVAGAWRKIVMAHGTCLRKRVLPMVVNR